MMQTLTQNLLIIVVVTVATVTTRMLPFWVFPPNRPTPPYVRYLGKVLAGAVIGLLIIYCLKSVSLTVPPYGAPEAVCIAGIILLHWWRRNLLLSIAAGTIAYMLLVQFVFTG